MRFKDNEGKLHERSKDAEFANAKLLMNKLKNKGVSKFKKVKSSFNNKKDNNIEEKDGVFKPSDYVPKDYQLEEVEDERTLNQLISELVKYDYNITVMKKDITLEEAEQISIITNLIRKRIDDIESSIFKCNN